MFDMDMSLRDPGHQAVRLVAGDRPSEYVLFDGMYPLGHVQGRKPQGRSGCRAALGLRCMLVGEIERNEKARVGVDAQWKILSQIARR